MTQKTAAQMAAEILANLPSGNPAVLTAASLRVTLNDMVASYQANPQVRAVTGTTDTIAVGDLGYLITYSNGSPIAVTLPQATGSFASFNVSMFNLGAGTVTITPTISTIKGAATYTLTTNQSVTIVSDGANYQVTNTINATGVANPTAKVGPTATNGTATTALRSDGAPAIDLTATYGWTGPHTFTQAAAAGATIRSGAAGSFALFDIGRTATEFSIGAAGGSDQFFTGTVAGDAAIKAWTNLWLGSNGAGTPKGGVKINTVGNVVHPIGLSVGPDVAQANNTVAAVKVKATINNNTVALPDNVNSAVEVWGAQVGMADGVPGGVGLDSFGTGNFTAFSVMDFRRANGTAAAPTALKSGDLIGVLGALGYKATGYSDGAAQVRFFANQDWSDSVQGSRIEILATPNGSGAGSITSAAKFLAAGTQILGTNTNDNAATGWVGEHVRSSNGETGIGQGSNTVTITIASPAVITWGATTPFTGNAVVNFTTTWALPTGIVAGTNYYVIGSSISGNTFQIATSIDNAIAGTAVNTSGTQSGTHTGVPTAILANGTAVNIAGISLTAGDWDVSGMISFFLGNTTSITLLQGSISTVSATADLRPGRLSQYNTPAAVPGTSNNAFSQGPTRISISATTTIYLVASANFTVSTNAAWGGIRARRVR